VTIVVAVLIASCQVSLYLKSGPLASQSPTTAQAAANVPDLPDVLAAILESCSYQLCFLIESSCFVWTLLPKLVSRSNPVAGVFNCHVPMTLALALHY
jgi:hypothetical protein